LLAIRVTASILNVTKGLPLSPLGLKGRKGVISVHASQSPQQTRA